MNRIYVSIAFISGPSGGSARPFMLRSMQPLIRSSSVRTSFSRPMNSGKTPQTPASGRPNFFGARIQMAALTFEPIAGEPFRRIGGVRPDRRRGMHDQVAAGAHRLAEHVHRQRIDVRNGPLLR